MSPSSPEVEKTTDTCALSSLEGVRESSFVLVPVSSGRRARPHEPRHSPSQVSHNSFGNVTPLPPLSCRGDGGIDAARHRARGRRRIGTSSGRRPAGARRRLCFTHGHCSSHGDAYKSNSRSGRASVPEDRRISPPHRRRRIDPTTSRRFHVGTRRHRCVALYQCVEPRREQKKRKQYDNEHNRRRYERTIFPPLLGVVCTVAVGAAMVLPVVSSVLSTVPASSEARASVRWGRWRRG